MPLPSSSSPLCLMHPPPLVRVLFLILGQIGDFLGYKLPKKDYVQDIVQSVFSNITLTNWQDTIQSFVYLGILVFMKECGKRYKKLKWMRVLGPLTVTVISMSVTAIGNRCARHLFAAAATSSHETRSEPAGFSPPLCPSGSRSTSTGTLPTSPPERSPGRVSPGRPVLPAHLFYA